MYLYYAYQLVPNNRSLLSSESRHSFQFAIRPQERVCYDNGKVMIFKEGRYAVNSPTFTVARAVDTQMQLLKFDEHQVCVCFASIHSLSASEGVSYIEGRKAWRAVCDSAYVFHCVLFLVLSILQSHFKYACSGVRVSTYVVHCIFA